MSASDDNNAAAQADRGAALRLERAVKVLNDALCDAAATGLTVQVHQGAALCPTSPGGQHVKVTTAVYRQVLSS